MFEFNALAILTSFTLIALCQLAVNILAPARLQPGPLLWAGAIYLATFCTGLVIAFLAPSSEVSMVSVIIAGLVNICAVLGTSFDWLSRSRLAEAREVLRWWVRRARRGEPRASRPARRSEGSPCSVVPSRSAMRSVHAPMQERAAHASADPLLLLLLAAASRLAISTTRPNHLTGRAQRSAAFASPLPLRPHHRVPHRPNRLPTTALAFLLSVDPKDAPDLFADARRSMGALSALAHRVRLVALEPRRPRWALPRQSIWPTIFSEPDPAWRTSYGRLPALALGV